MTPRGQFCLMQKEKESAGVSLVIASPRVLTSTVEQSSSKATSCFCTVASSWKEGGGVNQGGPPGRGWGTHLPLTLPGPVEEVQQHGRVVYLLLLWHTVEAYAFGGLLQRVPSEGENGTETHTSLVPSRLFALRREKYVW